MIDGLILHLLEPGHGLFPGSEVQLTIDELRRKKLAKVHSGGHLIDVAMNKVGRSDLVPTKGFHDVEGAYVEYQGIVETE